MTTTLLKLENIRKSFAGVHALRGVSFELKSGEIHALVGENGAGKSTLIKIITGAHQPDSGTMEIEGHLIAENDPVISRSLGIAVIYQQPRTVARFNRRGEHCPKFGKARGLEASALAGAPETCPGIAGSSRRND